MTPCSSLQHIFTPPMPENPTLLESLDSWDQIKHIKPETSGFTEIFGELHFNEKPISDLDTGSDFEKLFNSYGDRDEKDQRVVVTGSSKSKKNKEIQHHCTEGLGIESSDEVEETKRDGKEGCCKDEMAFTTEWIENMEINGGFKRSRKGHGFPPPISSIGRGGKPWVCLKPFRYDGRFILRKIRIPTHEFLHASREDGRLKLHFVQRDEEQVQGEKKEIHVVEEEEEEEEEELKEIREEELKVAEEEEEKDGNDNEKRTEEEEKEEEKAEIGENNVN